MGMDLMRPGGGHFGSLMLNWRGWRKLLQLAETHGWVPEGTRPPPDCAHDWSGSYYSNDGQEVTASDAAVIAAAQEQAYRTHDDQSLEVWIDEEGTLKDLNQYASFRELLAEFVNFCRGGRVFYLVVKSPA